MRQEQKGDRMSSPENYTALGVIGGGDNHKPRIVTRKSDGREMRVCTLFVDDFFGRKYIDNEGVERKERKQISLIFDEPQVQGAWGYLRPGRRVFISGRHYCNPRASTYHNPETGVMETRVYANETVHPYTCRFVDIPVAAMITMVFNPLAEKGMITEEQIKMWSPIIEKANSNEETGSETSQEEPPPQKDLDTDEPKDGESVDDEPNPF